MLGNEPLTVDDVRVGVFYTAAQISGGHVGVAFTPRGLTDAACCPQSTAEAPLAGRLAGRSAWSIAEYALLVMAGPTASPWPPTFFARGVNVLGGIRVTDGPKLLEIVGQGGSGYFFGQGTEKVCFVRVDQ